MIPSNSAHIMEAANCTEEYCEDIVHQLNRDLVAFFANLSEFIFISDKSYTNVTQIKKDREDCPFKNIHGLLSLSFHISGQDILFRQTSGLYNLLSFQNVLL
ncbi:hypothetical protein CDAR_227871 [Caerostris darwini]|uniref:Uncharacterized protein n=1 Tax=Caerostris darwini TaxID=1538125 RepID=A0AAV4PJZ0_9ARAC|nr:hypothetical protein CDAR_227871 [Caerostris darwini]